MADDKDGREEQARNQDRRQRRRDVVAELERMDETEPPTDTTALGEFEDELDTLEYPVTGAEVVAAMGDRELEAADRTYTVEELVPETDEETFDDPPAIRERVQRPTVAAAMKRIVEAAGDFPGVDLRRSQFQAYERTLRELTAIDAVDDDEGVRVIADWVIERLREKEKLPGSRAVRRQAAKYCRTNGYRVRNDEWLGV